jgi:hypothetical protein
MCQKVNSGGVQIKKSLNMVKKNTDSAGLIHICRLG